MFQSTPDTILVIGFPPVNLSRKQLTRRFNDLLEASFTRPLTGPELREIRRINKILNRVEASRPVYISPIMLPPLPPRVLVAPWLLLGGVLGIFLTAGTNSALVWIIRAVLFAIAVYGAANLPEDQDESN